MGATGYSGFWGGSLTLLVDRNPLERVLTRTLKKIGKRQELMLTLNGAAAGSTATKAKGQVSHSTSELGGVRTVASVNEVNRATTSADKTAGDALLSQSTRVTTPSDGAGDWPA